MADAATIASPPTRPVSGTAAMAAALEISVIEARIKMLENEEETYLRDIDSIDRQLSGFESSRQANASEATRLNCVI